MCTERVVAVFALTLFAACGSAHVPQATPYAVRDSAQWQCGGNGGWLAVLYHGDAYVDSIDLSTGFQTVPGGVIFAPVRSEEGTVCPAGPVLLQGQTRRTLEGLLPLFDPFFPARTVLDSSIFYWGFVGHRAYATRYNLTTHRADTAFLVEDSTLFQTDNRYQFLPPTRRDSTFTYETWTGRKFIVGRGMRLVTDSLSR